jgi:hypothetical protein
MLMDPHGIVTMLPICACAHHFTYLFRGSAVLERTWPPHICKASTYTGRHKTERRRQTSMPRAGLEPTIPVSERSRPTPQTARQLWPAAHSVTLPNN